MPGDVNLWPNLTGGQAIDLLGRLRGGLDEKLRAELIERFELDPTKKGRSYSKGNRQKVALVAALSSDVELLVLDEPTSGLDPLMEAVFQEYVDRFRDDGHAVLLSSHILAEVERLCDRVSIIRGRPCASSPAPSPTSATSPVRRSRAELATPTRGAARPAARPRPGDRGQPGPVRGRAPAASTPRSTRSRRPACGR